MRLAGREIDGADRRTHLVFDYDHELFLKLFNYSVDKESIELVVDTLDYAIIIDVVDHNDETMWVYYRKVWPVWLR